MNRPVSVDNDCLANSKTRHITHNGYQPASPNECHRRYTSCLHCKILYLLLFLLSVPINPLRIRGCQLYETLSFCSFFVFNYHSILIQIFHQYQPGVLKTKPFHKLSVGIALLQVSDIQKTVSTYFSVTSFMKKVRIFPSRPFIPDRDKGTAFRREDCSLFNFCYNIVHQIDKPVYCK